MFDSLRITVVLLHALVFSAMASELGGALTSLDVQGPDGVIYPDFSRAGLQEGKRQPSKTIKVVDHGAFPDDEEDDTQALQAAFDAAGEAGGALVQLEAGQYDLSAPLYIYHSGVVIRGAGRDQTRLVFAYTLQKQEVRIVRPAEGEVLSSAGVIAIHADPKRLKKFTLFINGKEILSRGPDTTGGARFSMVYPMEVLLEKEKLAPGSFEIMAVVERMDGTRTETKKAVEWDPEEPAKPSDNRYSSSVAVLNFLGDVRAHRKGQLKLVKTVRRGESKLSFREQVPWKAGDLLYLEMKPTKARLMKLESARKDFPIRAMAWVEGVAEDGKTVQLAAPLRHDFEAISTWVSRAKPMEYSGLEDLTLEQTAKQWINGVQFSVVANCWATGVRVFRAGRNPLGMGRAKNCLIQDCVFEEIWYRGGGGTGYIGWTAAWDCLMEEVRCRDLRHAPNLQSSAAGNVIRKSRFIGSDVNFHMLWAHENLIEQCEIDAKRGTGSYGYGVYAQKPDVAIHGPGGGPRNVIYNNKIVAPFNAVFLGGSNFNWIFAYNELKAGKGPVFVMRKQNTGHQILSNILTAQQSGQPALEFKGEGIANLTIEGNRLSGTDVLVAGESKHLVENENEPLTVSPPAAPEAPSLYEWQRQNAVSSATASTLN